MAAENGEKAEGAHDGQAAIRHIRHARLKRAAGGVIAVGCLMVVVSWWVPWVTIIPPAGAAVAVRAVDGSPGGAPFILGCPGLGLVLPLVVLLVAAFDWWRHESPRMPLPLVFIAAIVGLICVPILVVICEISSISLCCVRGPSQVVLMGAGGLVALAGYVMGLVGCMLALG